MTVEITGLPADNADTRNCDRRDSVGAEDCPSISVVVIGRNEGARLDRCLASVRACDYPSDRIELIYVDSDSSDDSRTIAADHGARVIHLQSNRLTAAAARNSGYAEATADIVQFLDGDTVLNPHWLEAGARALREEAVACVFGRLEEIAPHDSIYNFWAHHDWHFPPGYVEACGGVAMFRRTILVAAGGYDATLIAGEERDLSYRMINDHSCRILCLNEPMALHDLNMTRFRQYWRRCVRAGYSYAEVGSRYRGLRTWRRTCLRNAMHALFAVASVVLCLVLGRPWPVLVWVAVVLLLVSRDAVRCRARTASLGQAWLLGFHHYLSKCPTVLGHLDYCLRRLVGSRRKKTIEHRLDG